MKIISTIEFIKKSPSKFGFSSEPTSSELVGRVVSSAVALGERSVSVQIIDKWCFVCSEGDWIIRNHSNIIDKQDIFSTIIPLPELGEEQSRPEVFISAFAEHIFIREVDGEVLGLKGGDLPERLQDRLTEMQPFIVGFKL